MQIINRLNWKNMKTIIKNIITGFISGTLISGLYSCEKASADFPDAGYASIMDVAADGATLISDRLGYALSDNLTFNESELDILLHMKEEEKLARDVYTTLYEKWGTLIFSNISKAEDTHLKAVISLLQNYGEEYTKIGETGVFSNPDFQELYRQLVAKGSESVEEAYRSGALIEEMDIKDLTEYLAVVSNENIIMVFENLQKGSRNHLRAFNRQIEILGTTYTSVYISQEEYDQIVSSPNEKGNSYRIYRKGNQYRKGW